MHKVKILFCVTSLKGMRYKTAWYVLGKNSWLRVAEKATARGECQLILKKKKDQIIKSLKSILRGLGTIKNQLVLI